MKIFFLCLVAVFNADGDFVFHQVTSPSQTPGEATLFPSAESCEAYATQLPRLFGMYVPDDGTLQHQCVEVSAFGTILKQSHEKSVLSF